MNDKVNKYNDIVRKQWSKPGGTVLNALSQAEVDESTATSIEIIDLDKHDDNMNITNSNTQEEAQADQSQIIAAEGMLM